MGKWIQLWQTLAKEQVRHRLVQTFKPIEVKAKEAMMDKQRGVSEKLADITKKLNEQMDSLDTNVRFGYSDKIGSMYISVTEKSTGREIRQIPSEEAMRLAEYFRDVIGMIFDKES